MPSSDFMMPSEFAQLYPDLARKTLVVLREHDGDHMWKREPDGWYRLEGAEDE